MVIDSYSWTVYDDDVAVKRTDMSVFKNYGSTIPVEIRPFFHVEDYKKGDSRKVYLHINNRSFQVKLERIRSSVGQTRIMWNSDFSDYINGLFPNVLNTFEYPELKFCRLDSSNYEISFVSSIQLIYKLEYEDDILESVITTSGNKEGRKVMYYTTKYERDPVNRKEAVRIHGTRCMACGFDFEETYGERGRDFIEVHHIKPLYDINEEVVINPSTDLICLCSNCHRMVHRKRDSILSLEDLKALLSNHS